MFGDIDVAMVFTYWETGAGVANYDVVLFRLFSEKLELAEGVWRCRLLLASYLFVVDTRLMECIRGVVRHTARVNHVRTRLSRPESLRNVFYAAYSEMCFTRPPKCVLRGLIRNVFCAA